MPDSITAAKRVYLADSWRVATAWAGIIFAVLISAACAFGLHFDPRQALFWLGPLVGAAALYWGIARARMEISSTGLRALVGGRWVSTEWSNLVAVRINDLYVGFETRQAVKGLGTSRRSGYRGATRELLAKKKYVPLDFYRRHFFHGDFVEEVERLAPHVVLRAELEQKYPQVWKHGRWTPVE